jgi:hypothetical protein
MQFFECLFRPLESEMRQQFSEVKQRLDRIDATLTMQGKSFAAHTGNVAGQPPGEDIGNVARQPPGEGENPQ